MRVFLFLVLVQIAFVTSAEAITVRLKKGIKDGESNGDWGDYLRRKIGKKKAKPINDKDKEFTEAEKKWFLAMKDHITIFVNRIHLFDKEVPGKEPPEDVSIIVGNRGGELAEHCRIFAICVDASKWQQQFGDAAKSGNSERMIEALKREYIKILKSKDGWPDF